MRANALENNVVLYKVEGGKRTDLARRAREAVRQEGARPLRGVEVSAVRVRGPLFEVILDGTKLYEVEDATLAGPGRVGVWTKADSVTLVRRPAAHCREIARAERTLNRTKGRLP